MQRKLKNPATFRRKLQKTETVNPPYRIFAPGNEKTWRMARCVERNYDGLPLCTITDTRNTILHKKPALTFFPAKKRGKFGKDVFLLYLCMLIMHMPVLLARPACRQIKT